jgi:hypothetical protein
MDQAIGIQRVRLPNELETPLMLRYVKWRYLFSHFSP